MGFKVEFNKEFDKGVCTYYADVMDEILAKDEMVVTIDADLMGCTGFAPLMEKYPGRVLQTGIMEANMMSMAGGLSAMGFKPYVATFASFATRRAFDQIFISVNYGKRDIVIFGHACGITTKDNGGTHMPFEDMALMRMIPGGYVIDVVDCAMLKDVMNKVKDMNGVIYVRGGDPAQKVYAEGSTFEIGKANLLRDGKDVTIIACGIMVPTALEAADVLAKEGIDARVVDMFTIKPLDEEMVIKCAKETGCIVTAENHSIIGGLGEAVAACLTENAPAPQVRVGVKDEHGEVGDMEYLRKRFGLTVDDIVAAAKKAVAKK